MTVRDVADQGIRAQGPGQGDRQRRLLSSPRARPISAASSWPKASNGVVTAVARKGDEPVCLLSRARPSSAAGRLRNARLQQAAASGASAPERRTRIKPSTPTSSMQNEANSLRQIERLKQRYNQPARTAKGRGGGRVPLRAEGRLLQPDAASLRLLAPAGYKS